MNVLRSFLHGYVLEIVCAQQVLRDGKVQKNLDTHGNV